MKRLKLFFTCVGLTILSVSALMLSGTSNSTLRASTQKGRGRTALPTMM